MEISGWTIAFLLAIIVGVVGFVIINTVAEQGGELPGIADSAACKFERGSCVEQANCQGTILEQECGEGYVCCQQQQQT